MSCLHIDFVSRGERRPRSKPVKGKLHLGAEGLLLDRQRTLSVRTNSLEMCQEQSGGFNEEVLLLFDRRAVALALIDADTEVPESAAHPPPVRLASPYGATTRFIAGLYYGPN